MQALQVVHDFNSRAGLLAFGYSDVRESAYPIEEMLEGFNLGILADSLRHNADDFTQDSSPREVSLEIIHQATSGFDAENMENVDRVDKHVDAIIYNFGSLFKLGLLPEHVEEAIMIVAMANLAKLTAGKDEHGKQLKPADFVPPEPQLLELLERVDAP